MMTWIIASVVGVLGIAGSLTFFGFLPALAPIFGALINVVARLLGAILKTRLGCSLMTAALVATVVYPMADIRGRQDIEARWAAANAKAEAEAQARDARVAAQVKAEAQTEIDSLKQTSDELAKKVADYEKELAARKGPVCVLNPNDVRRLRDITGQSKAVGKHP